MKEDIILLCSKCCIRTKHRLGFHTEKGTKYYCVVCGNPRKKYFMPEEKVIERRFF